MPIFDKKEDIFELLDKFEKSAAAEIEIADGDRRIHIKKSNAADAQYPPFPQISPLAYRSEVYGLNYDMPQPHGSVKSEIVSQGSENNNPTESLGKMIKSPLIGIYYSAPSPDSEPFVEVGKKIRKGDILCIIEAMKVMNEIDSEVDGEIAEIFVNNAQSVEYGQSLFRII